MPKCPPFHFVAYNEMTTAEILHLVIDNKNRHHCSHFNDAIWIVLNWNESEAKLK